MEIIKKLLVAIAIIATVMAVGIVGQLDHDEYIEVNSTPITKLP